MLEKLWNSFLDFVGNPAALLASFLVLVVVFGLTLMLTTSKPVQHNDILASAVMITNLAQDSGGTGVILDSKSTKSEILTNAHVCRVVEGGGYVTSNKGQRYLVSSYKPSTTQDLCLINVLADLGVHTTVANRPPLEYYEQASISGHPNLLPTVVTRGHFSGRSSIEVMVGLKPCSEEDIKNPMGSILCLILGGVPEMEQYDTMLVTATIMPGSSGSGVYNSQDELSGVVFAGSHDIGYAWIVPYENMKYFLDNESLKLEEKFPDNKFGLFHSSEEHSLYTKLHSMCDGSLGFHLGKICALSKEDAIWRK